MAVYLPLLLGTVNAVPDDSVLLDLPRGQVDYLSHDWREEDVWRSWRNMTRQKNDIANGVRLENASWRTWWKQRNGLGTVSPETLNWLKDSDVTWLYGPLHTYDDVDGIKRVIPDLPTKLPILPPSAQTSQPKKPILKHRSICELLTSDLLPTSPLFSPPESDDERPNPVLSLEERAKDLQESTAAAEADGSSAQRPPLISVKSDTHITRWGPNRAFRRDSPPRVIASEAPNEASEVQIGAHPLSRQSSMGSHSRSPQPSVADSGGAPRRRHITFNTFVEQCIAIDQPQQKPNAGSPGSGALVRERTKKDLAWASVMGGSGYEDDGYDEDSEGIVDDELSNFDEDVSTPRPAPPAAPSNPPRSSSPPPSSSPSRHTGSSSSSDDEDNDGEDALQMRVRQAAARSSNSTGNAARAGGSSSSSETSSSSSRSRGPRRRKSKSGSYNFQPPTIHPTYPQPDSQSKGYPKPGSYYPYPHDDETWADREKDLITIALIAPTMLKTHNTGSDESMDEARKGHWTTEIHSGVNAPVELVYLPPGYSRDIETEDIYPAAPPAVAHSDETANEGETETGAEVLSTNPSNVKVDQQVFDSLLVVSPEPSHRAADSETYFSKAAPTVVEVSKPTPALNVVISQEKVDEKRERSRSRSRSKSRSRSRSRTPSPNVITPNTGTESNVPTETPTAPVPVPQVKAASSASSALLSPPSSSGGQIARSNSSPQLYSQDSGSQSRGRSIARTNSFSDRERTSGSSTSSPMGSLSPDAAFGLGIASEASFAGGYGAFSPRDRDGRDGRDAPREGRRGRDKTGRGLGSSSGSSSSANSSKSPEESRIPLQPAADEAESTPRAVAPSSPVNVNPGALVVGGGDVQALASSVASISSSSGSSTVTPAKASTTAGSKLTIDSKHSISASVPAPAVTSPAQATSPPHGASFHLPSASEVSEEQARRSVQPTPTNSPVKSMKPLLPSPKSSYTGDGTNAPASPPTLPPFKSKASNKPSSPPPSASTSTSASHYRRPSWGGSRSPTRGGDVQRPLENGTLVSRAVEIMANAGAYFGSFWHAQGTAANPAASGGVPGASEVTTSTSGY